MSIFTRSSPEVTHSVLPWTVKGVTVVKSLCTSGSRAGGVICFRTVPVLGSISTYPFGDQLFTQKCPPAKTG